MSRGTSLSRIECDKYCFFFPTNHDYRYLRKRIKFGSQFDQATKVTLMGFIRDTGTCPHS
jgi:hypothetical protein